MTDGVARHVLIIGNRDDEHAAAVASAVRDRAEVSILDASTLPSELWQWSDGANVGLNGVLSRPCRGWLRRLSPPGWHQGIAIGSLEASEVQASLQLLAAMTDESSGIEWLTNYWRMIRAENKLVQYRHAKGVGVPVPDCRVASSSAGLTDLGDRFVVKPLGLGAYTRGDVTYAVHARVVEITDPALAGLAKAPYIAQRFIAAERHLRVATVRDRAWCCSISAHGLPVDWREDPGAHTAWMPDKPDDQLLRQAVAVATGLRLGYTCQDWIVDEAGTQWLVDVNPAGQWLFLPGPTAGEITAAIADWLVGGG